MLYSFITSSEFNNGFISVAPACCQKYFNCDIDTVDRRKYDSDFLMKIEAVITKKMTPLIVELTPRTTQRHAEIWMKCMYKGCYCNLPGQPLHLVKRYEGTALYDNLLTAFPETYLQELVDMSVLVSLLDCAKVKTDKTSCFMHIVGDIWNVYLEKHSNKI